MFFETSFRNTFGDRLQKNTRAPAGLQADFWSSWDLHRRIHQKGCSEDRISGFQKISQKHVSVFKTGFREQIHVHADH